MRIGMFADMYKPHISGVTNYISLYKSRFEELGHEVFVFTFGDNSYEDSEPNVIRSSGIPWGKTGWQMGMLLSAEAKRIIPTIDVAHVHHPFVSGQIALRKCEPHGIPVVFTNHSRYDIFADTYAGFVPRFARRAMLQKYLKGFASRVDMYIAPSAGIQGWLAEWGVTDRAVVHNNAIDTASFFSPDNPRSRMDFGWSDEEVVLCHLGRLGPEKNVVMLIESFIAIAGDAPSARLLVIGDGPMRESMEGLLAAHSMRDKAHFTGAASYDEVPGMLRAADVFVTASVSETFPLVVMEALAAELPAVGVRSAGVGEVIDDGVTGLLAENNVTDLAEKLMLITQDQALRLRMKEAAKIAASDFDIRPMADRLLSHYEKLIDSKRKLA
ncbi:MAG: glycosyltransferase [Actinobacteria bacterium]|nr:glycosyltransferase [Actinomycetota bacterium]